MTRRSPKVTEHTWHKYNIVVIVTLATRGERFHGNNTVPHI